eukprot:9049604-Pyramimonas_sp.AAC.2
MSQCAQDLVTAPTDAAADVNEAAKAINDMVWHHAWIFDCNTQIRVRISVSANIRIWARLLLACCTCTLVPVVLCRVVVLSRLSRILSPWRSNPKKMCLALWI